MVWWFTKGKHNLSIHPLVRKWLRLGAWGKFGIAFVLFFFFLGAFGVAEATGGETWSGFTKFLMWSVWLLWLLEVLVDAFVTTGDIGGSASQIALGTRGEYIGGHPQLPHGRFVYLTLGGTREDPQMRVELPQPDGQQALIFPIPLLDVQEASERRELANTDLALGQAVGNSLANVSFRSKGMGQQAFLNVNYAGAAGRKHVVEFGNFLLGDDEIQNWRNYIVCSQAEADTGEIPYGPWQSLLSEEEIEEELKAAREEEAAVEREAAQALEAFEEQESSDEKPVDQSPEESDRIKG